MTPKQPEINLLKLVHEKIEKLGAKGAQDFFNVGEGQIRKIIASNQFPDVRICQKVLDEYLPGFLKKIQSGEFVGETLPAPQQGTTRPETDPGAPEAKPTTLGDAEDTRPDFSKLGEAPANTAKGGWDEKALANLPEFPSLAENEDGCVFILRNRHFIKVPPSPYAMAMPSLRDINFFVMLSVLANWKSTLPPEIQKLLAPFHGEKDTLICHARNSIAMRFLESGQEWSFWGDDDNMPPTGNANWFKARTGANWRNEFLSVSALRRLTSHGKTIVGGVYAERNGTGRLLIAVEDPLKSPLAAELKTKGPQNRLEAVPWVAFGMVAVHRQVFLDIQAKCPELAPTIKGTPWKFFTPYEGGPHGEDVTFCNHAIAAGHQPYLDLGCFGAHLGTQAFLP